MNKKTNLKTCLLIALLFLGIYCTTAVGDIIYVDADSNTGGDGLSWATAYKYLQDALADAQVSGDDIWVAEGTYKPDANAAEPNGTGDRAATFQLINGVGIYGGFDGTETGLDQRDWQNNETILSGDLDGNDVPVGDPYDLRTEPTRAENSYHVVTGSGTEPNAVLDGFTIIAGNPNGPDPDDDGGGMYSYFGSPTVTNCLLSKNSARGGGGIYNNYYSDPNITNCTFSENGSFCGGGMENANYSSPTVTNCTFIGNSVQNNGGGMVNWYYCNPTVTNCTFSGNSAYRGGGMFNFQSDTTVTNCTFIGNSASYGGGGMGNANSSGPMLTNCTFSGNSGTDGNGIACVSCGCDPNGQPYPGTVDIRNCILWNGGDEIWNNDGSTITISYSDITGGWEGAGNTSADPCFVDPNSGDFHLLPNSPCIDTGDPNYWPFLKETDIDGEPRVMGGRVDMGVDEFTDYRPFIGCSPIEFEFSSYEDGPNPEPQVLYISNTGYGTLNWEIIENCSWLEAAPNAGSLSSSETNDVTLSIDTAGLAYGGYNYELEITDPCAANTPIKVPVNLNVIGPEIELSAVKFEFWATEGTTNPDSQILTIRNSGGGTLNWTINYDCNWLEVDPNTGSLTKGEANEVTLSVDIAGLTWDLYNCTVVISDPNASNDPQTIQVELRIFMQGGIDFGDCPDPNYPTLLAQNGARHIIDPNVFLGSTVDEEFDGQPTISADGDDLNYLADEDGVFFLTDIRQGEPADVNVIASKYGLLDAWIDFNIDGDWNDPGEQIFTSFPLNSGNNILNFNVPFTLPTTDPIIQTYARFRFSTMGGLSYDGPADDGEVEDYMVTIHIDCLIGGNAGPEEYNDWVAWGKPDCWCYPRQCRGDIDGRKIGPYWVQTKDLALFRAAFGRRGTDFPSGGICADLDHRQIGAFRVQAVDLKLFRTYFNKRPPHPNAPTPCDQIHPTNPYVPWQTTLYVGPFNFWITP